VLFAVDVGEIKGPREGACWFAELDPVFAPHRRRDSSFRRGVVSTQQEGQIIERTGESVSQPATEGRQWATAALLPPSDGGHGDIEPLGEALLRMTKGPPSSCEFVPPSPHLAILIAGQHSKPSALPLTLHVSRS
jgi:hypothetical protein